MNVRSRILISMITLTIGCGIAVLVSSIFLFYRETNNAMYDKNNVAENVVRHELDRLKTQAYVAVLGMANTAELREALINNDLERITYIANTLKNTAQLDYCTIVDHTGTVLLRTHSPDDYDDSIAYLPQISAALEGETEVHFIQGPIVLLGISAGAPIYDDDMNIIGVVSMGFRLDNRDLAEYLKALTGCEITFFRDDIKVASTLWSEDGTPLTGTRVEERVSERVFAGETYIGRIELFGRNVLAKFFPLYSMKDEIVGMVFVGNYTEEETNKILLFIVSGTLITLAVLIVCVVIALLISGSIIKKMNEANERLMLMLDSSPLCAQIWDRDLNTIDCNEAGVRLYKFKNKAEYTERFLKECSPEFQPDGQRSDEKAVNLVHQAFKEGYCSFEWMHRIPDSDTPVPAEVTLVRVKYGNDDAVVGYTRDMRDITKMERKIHYLEAENEKIFYDALTGIHNRRFFDESINRVLRSLARTSGMLSMMMIDIDFFKKYNDTYGHNAGDECLKIVADIISKSISRVADFAARYGGEEFVVVLPNTDETGALALAEKMLESIRECNILHEESEVEKYVTFSIGVTTGSVQRFRTADDFVKKADKMLYLSKQSGRNRCRFERL